MPIGPPAPAVALVLIGVVIGLIVMPGGGSSPTTGYDASYPQCSRSYPPNHLFVVVGVNDGLANRANPCLDGELRWASGAPGQERPMQPRLSLYIDTANPGACTSTPLIPVRTTSRIGQAAVTRLATEAVTGC